MKKLVSEAYSDEMEITNAMFFFARHYRHLASTN